MNGYVKAELAKAILDLERYEQDEENSENQKELQTILSRLEIVRNALSSDSSD